MTWASENLRPASFRGIEFKVGEHEHTRPKAVAVHEFPGRNRPFVEELGRLARQFDVDAYLVGADYLARRDQLLEALDEEGPGELIHPWLGRLNVHATLTRLHEDASSLRTCRIGISFVEAGTNFSPDARVDPASAVDDAGAVMLDAAAEAFAAVVLDASRPGTAVEGAASGWERVAETLSTFDLSGPAGTAASWRARFEDLSDNVLERLGQPGEFSEALREIFRSLENAVGSRRELLRLLLRLAGDEHARKQPLLFGGADADAGDQALSAFVARDAAAEAARLSVLLDWETYDEAFSTRQSIVVLLEDLAASADDATYHRLQDLISELVAGLPAPDANLPRLDTVTLQRTRPAIVLAYQLYDAAERDAEIVARNRVRNPAFLPSLVPLQILVDAG